MMVVEVTATPRTSWYKEHSYGTLNLSRNRTKAARMEPIHPAAFLTAYASGESLQQAGRAPSAPQCSSQGRRAPAGRQQPSCTSQ